MTSNSLPGTPRLMISLAHPDDESFGMGGTIAKYTQQGVNVSLICATNGDVGSVDDHYMERYGTIADLRLDELRCAATTLGIQDVITYGYRDSGMMGSPENDHPDCLWQADEDVVVGRIVADIRRLRPQVIVTFNDYGGYGHPDHIYMHRATTRAFFEAGDPDRYPEQIADGLKPYQPAKLYYYTYPKLGLRLRIWNVRLHGQDPRRIGKNQDIDLQAALDHIPPAHARIDVAGYLGVWDAAAECHASQINPGSSFSLITTIQRFLQRRQSFHRAYPPRNGHEKMERDLFEGIS